MSFYNFLSIPMNYFKNIQIRFENISKLPILIADSNTETAFVTLLHAAYNQIEHNNSENKKLSELRNSLLPQLMSGKIDVSRIRARSQRAALSFVVSIGFSFH